jgi:hypothetical protein
MRSDDLFAVWAILGDWAPWAGLPVLFGGIVLVGLAILSRKLAELSLGGGDWRANMRGE